MEIFQTLKYITGMCEQRKCKTDDLEVNFGTLGISGSQLRNQVLNFG